MKYRLFLVMFFATSFALAPTMAAQSQSKAKKEQTKPVADTSRKPVKRVVPPPPPLSQKAKKDTAFKTTSRKH